MPSTGSRSVFLLFGLAVAAALGAVAWLAFSGGPSGPDPSRPPADTPGPKTRKEDPPLPPPPKDRPPQGRTVRTMTFEIQGEVLGSDGAPVPGADVVALVVAVEPPGKAPAEGGPEAEKVPAEVLREMFALTPEEAAAATLYSGVPAAPAKEPESREVARAATGEDGKFSLRTGGRGPFRLEARKEGLGHAVTGEVFAGGPPVTMRLGPSEALRGRVLAAVGDAPVEGAAVVARSGRLHRTATTGADGSFSLADLPPGTYAVTAGAAGFAPTVLPAVPVPSPSPLDLRLGGGHALRVVVMKREPPRPGERRAPGTAPPPGPPLEGALVVVLNPHEGTYRSAAAGQDGTARIERLGPGDWKVAARKEGFTVGQAGARFKPGGVPEETREIRLEALVPTPLRILGADGAPLRNAKVFTGGEDEEYDERLSRLLGTTDDAGLVPVVFDPSVPWKAVAWVVPEEGAAVVKVEEPEEAGVETKVVVRPGRVVQGTVRDGAGKPVKGAQVYVEVIDDDAEVDIGLYAYTDAAGRYRFPPLPFGDTTIEAATDDGDAEPAEVEAADRESPLVRDLVIPLDE